MLSSRNEGAPRGFGLPVWRGLCPPGSDHVLLCVQGEPGDPGLPGEVGMRVSVAWSRGQVLTKDHLGRGGGGGSGRRPAHPWRQVAWGRGPRPGQCGGRHLRSASSPCPHLSAHTPLQGPQGPPGPPGPPGHVGAPVSKGAGVAGAPSAPPGTGTQALRQGPLPQMLTEDLLPMAVKCCLSLLRPEMLER